MPLKFNSYKIEIEHISFHTKGETKFPCATAITLYNNGESDFSYLNIAAREQSFKNTSFVNGLGIGYISFDLTAFFAKTVLMKNLR